MRVEFNQTSYAIFKIIEQQAKNNIKTPLGLISLMVNLNHNYDLVQQTDKTTKETEMEM